MGRLGLMMGTSAAAGALGHSLLSSRKPENQNTNNTQQTKNINNANNLVNGRGKVNELGK